MTVRDSWGSRIGFIFAVAGSAIGLGNIWRFPYIVGTHGGAAFIAIYIICLLLIGFPVLISEILIGRTTQKSPGGAFLQLGKKKGWEWIGKMTILTGFIVSAFYSAVAGWVLGYLVEAIGGYTTHFDTHAQAQQHYTDLISSAWWTVGYQGLFLLMTTAVLYFGVRKGIERGNKIMMPLLFAILIFLVIKGLMMPNASKGLRFLLAPEWGELTPTAIMIALGQSFFTLSIGQGTMVTYGSYLAKHDNLVKSCIPIVIMDTLVALFAAIAVFTIVFSVGLEPDSGPGLVFQTLPLVFSQIPGGYFLSLLFFLLVFLAALSSEISALEPTIAYLVEEKKWKRTPAVLACGLGAFLLGIPSALSFSLLQDEKPFGVSFLELFDFTCTSILIPLGGLAAVLLIGWKWGFSRALHALKEGAGSYFSQKPWLVHYFRVCIKYTAPILIILVFLHAVTQG
jgi:neurotransmitter:Na+ symporter, NSS family